MSAAIAWTEAGYIEFMESAFTQVNVDDLQRLILHEKAHFLWATVFSETLRDDWIALGDWWSTSADRNGWATLQETLRDLSDLADTCIQGALDRLSAWLSPLAET